MHTMCAKDDLTVPATLPPPGKGEDKGRQGKGRERGGERYISTWIWMHAESIHAKIHLLYYT